MAIYTTDPSALAYQAQLQSILQQQKAADALQQQNLAPRPTQVVTGYAVRESPTAMLSRLLSAGVGAYQSQQADQQLQKLVQGGAPGGTTADAGQPVLLGGPEYFPDQPELLGGPEFFPGQS